ncbi:hypothetical protein V6N11_008957 [Hibiscus sabdariffa]|uniref:Uncharacterized protein n=1 Tax=Hibiscus sabdariffa TaxID=183260 RepID=A0ABR2PPA8_9ROSI
MKIVADEFKVFTDMLVQHVPSPKDVAAKKVDHIYTGPKQSMIESDCSVFDAFGRVYSDRIQTGQTLRVLGEGYSPDEEEDMT